MVLVFRTRDLDAGLSLMGVFNPAGFEIPAIGATLNLPCELPIIGGPASADSWSSGSRPTGMGGFLPELLEAAGVADAWGKDAILMVCSLFRRPSCYTERKANQIRA